MKIKKSTGLWEEFRTDKYLRSVKGAGASKRVAEEVLEEIEKSLKANTSTDLISKRTAKALVRHDPKLAANYNLRRGLAILGPAGFLFEHFISELLRAEGYKNRRNVYAKGKCITHEVDVVASDDMGVYFVEVKYHNKHHKKTHVDIAMYAYARLLDIVPSETKRNGSADGKKREMWLITNTKFTRSAIRYGECQKMKLIGWNYPKKNNLRDLIVNNNLYPVSSIPTISRNMLEVLANHHILLTRDLCKYTPKELAKIAGVSIGLAERVYKHSLVCTPEYYEN